LTNAIAQQHFKSFLLWRPTTMRILVTPWRIMGRLIMMAVGFLLRSMANRNQRELSIIGKDVVIESRASDHIWIAAVRDFSVTA